MIEPTEKDIGRKVIYRDDIGPVEPPEEGVITSFNPRFVFVRYGGEATSKATRREDLDWVSK